MSARDEIIGRIRAAQSNLPAPTQHEPAFRRHWDAERPEILERFVQRLSDYHVTVLHAPTEAHIASVAERQLASRGIASLVIPADLPAGWRPSHPAPIEDIGLAFEDLDAVAGVMTGSLLGIAETGTVVLNAGVAQGPAGADAACPTTIYASCGRPMWLASCRKRSRPWRPAWRALRPLRFSRGLRRLLISSLIESRACMGRGLWM